MFTVYLSGPIAGLTFDQAAGGWREEVDLALSPNKFEVLCPMRGKSFLRKEGILTKSGEGKGVNPKSIVARDLHDIRRADLVLVYLAGVTSVSIGTMFEMGYAHALDKPIILVMEPEGNCHDHLFVRELASSFYSEMDLEDALAEIIVWAG